MANKEDKKKIIEIDLGGVKDKVDTFTSEEKISELEKIQLGNNAIKQIQTSTPTYKPKNWYEQVCLTAGKLWININNVWTRFLSTTDILDEDDMTSDSDTAIASQQSIKAYVDAVDTELVNDTTPQLGGDLDLNGKNIDFPTTANISDCLDEDDMASDSATKLATQQSIKAYVDSKADDSLIKSFVYGEAITDGDALFVADGGETIASPESFASGDTSENFGREGSNIQRIGQSFQSSTKFVMDKVSVYLNKANTPTDSVEITIEGDDGGEPDGTPLGTAILAVASITGADTYEIDLDVEVTIEASTTYWVVFGRTGALDDTNYYTTIKKAGDEYTNGDGYIYIGSWADRTADYNFDFNIPVTAGRVYKTKASDTDFIDFIGFADATGVRGDVNDVVIRGIKTKTGWGLTAGVYYYLSNTTGEIGTTTGINGLRVGVALTATDFLIMDEFEIPAGFSFVASDNLQSSADTERTTSSLSYVKKKEIQVNFDGAVRVKFDMNSWDNNPSYHTYGRVYINGVAQGTERDLTDNNYVTYSEDFNVSSGDLIQLYLKISTVGGTAYCKNFKLYFNKVIVEQTIVNTD